MGGMTNKPSAGSEPDEVWGKDGKACFPAARYVIAFIPLEKNWTEGGILFWVERHLGSRPWETGLTAQMARRFGLLPEDPAAARPVGYPGTLGVWGLHPRAPTADTPGKMSAPNNVSVTVPSLSGSSTGLVSAVWHAVDGVRVEVDFPLNGAPLLPVGRAGELRFHRSDTGETASALGKVAFRGDSDTSRSFHFLFGERTRQTLASLLEPRRAFRVHPDPDQPVSVTISVPGVPGAIIGAARDISKSGLGIDIPWEHEAALSKQDVVELRMRLPGQAEELVFTSRIRNRALGAGAINYGIEFSVGALPEDDPKLMLVGEYVALRSKVIKREAASGLMSA